ncbi:MAG TPA: F0F1 ATP synthase subunit delta [Candidatus Paceibacterota bacterium]|nr:F0F1 ATP synthase subunit delta [Candidatus Paceibacterota bacterium]
MEKTYAQALNNALQNGKKEDELVSWLLTHLKAEGRTKLLPAIVRELKALQARTKTLGATVEVALEADKATALTEARAEGIDATEVTVNPNLISGWRAREGGRLIDRSGKRALVDIYRRITS